MACYKHGKTFLAWAWDFCACCIFLLQTCLVCLAVAGMASLNSPSLILPRIFSLSLSHLSLPALRQQHVARARNFVKRRGGMRQEEETKQEQGRQGRWVQWRRRTGVDMGYARMPLPWHACPPPACYCRQTLPSPTASFLLLLILWLACHLTSILFTISLPFSSLCLSLSVSLLYHLLYL